MRSAKWQQYKNMKFVRQVRSEKQEEWNGHKKKYHFFRSLATVDYVRVDVAHAELSSGILDCVNNSS